MTSLVPMAAPATAYRPGIALADSPAQGFTGRANKLLDLNWRLFRNGQQGAIYIPRPQLLGQQVLFQDNAGTTPVTADGDPVGLMLDLRKGLVRGPELITNGTFDTDTDWTLGTDAVIANGYLEQPGGAGGFNYQTVTTVAGKWYLVTFDVQKGSFFGGVWDTAPTTTILAGGVTFEAGEGSLIFQAVDSDSTFGVTANGTGDARVDNVSVRKLPGNHASQATSASRPTYRTDGLRHWLEFDGVDDILLHASRMGFAVNPELLVSSALTPTSSSDEEVQRVFQLGSSTDDLAGAGGSQGWSWRYDGGNVIYDSVTDNQTVVATFSRLADSTYGDAKFYRNGVEISSTSKGNEFGVPVDDQEKFSIFGDYDGANNVAGNFYGMVVSGDQSDSIRLPVEQYLAQLAGVTL